MREHWMARADRVSDGDFRILGEDERGDLLIPVRGLGWGVWRDLYNPRNPAHWQYWLRSRLTMRIAFLETP